MYISWEKFIEQRDIVLDILFLSVTEGRLNQEELVEVAKRLFGLTEIVESDIEIFRRVRDDFERSRREIWL